MLSLASKIPETTRKSNPLVTMSLLLLNRHVSVSPLRLKTSVCDSGTSE
jgi:hypothetical protein